ncbi:phospholipid transport system substrate-binding protein [Litorivivens lipolytica]|uniref:Phospholipid transport system substrate-binding protein n=1 Tax=Litorivivens lipolytica TaxID=1524264 RepID=A0A7W4W458_9GAMM|nr:ABC transporter substrate-binding protein [Litorivivens lipolytica]MBB3047107.1 phospholipid transport system substrate-binding protein [Litorivivens lipolytica]
MTMYQKLISLVSVVVLMLTSVSAWAAEPKGPYEVVADTTSRVTKVIEEARSYVDEDPQRFYDEVEKILSDVVDFPSFARGVMGKYGSKRYYDTLSDAEKQKFRERVERFTETFQDRLIQTYAKGLLAFDGNRIEVLPLAEDADKGGSVNVEQHIYGNAPQPYVVYYKLKQGRDGEWKLRNVSIEGVNLGRTYQSQFSSAVRRHNGDIDKVIENWEVAPEGAVGDDGSDDA